MDSLISLSPELLDQRAEVKRPSVEGAAREFETMLLAQWLKSARDAGSVLAEQSDMAGADSYMEMAEKALAETMAGKGTFGLARMMVRELTNERGQAEYLEPSPLAPRATTEWDPSPDR
jgi:Rod binding domain-containing protein